MSEEIKQNVAVDVEKDPFLVVEWPDENAKLRVTLSFDGDFLPMFPLPGDIKKKISEQDCRDQFARNLFAYIGAVLQGGVEEETESDE